MNGLYAKLLLSKNKDPVVPFIHTEPLDKRLDHRNDALDVPEVRVEVIQDGAVSCIR